MFSKLRATFSVVAVAVMATAASAFSDVPVTEPLIDPAPIVVTDEPVPVEFGFDGAEIGAQEDEVLLAQFTPPDMDPVVLPVTADSIVDEIATAGADILVAGLPIMIGFALIWVLIGRLTGRAH